MFGRSSQEAVEDGPWRAEGFDAYEGVCANDGVDVVIEHEVGIDEDTSHCIEVEVPKEVGFVGPGGK